MLAWTAVHGGAVVSVSLLRPELCRRDRPLSPQASSASAVILDTLDIPIVVAPLGRTLDG